MTQVNLRMTQEEKKTLAELAQKDGSTPSTYMRWLLAQARHRANMAADAEAVRAWNAEHGPDPDDEALVEAQTRDMAPLDLE